MYVIFDMDGVIFDSERAIIEEYKKLAPKYGLGDITQACIESIGCTWEKTRDIFCSYHGEGLDFKRLREDVHRELLKKDFDIKPGVYEIFEWLSEQKIPVALASSTNQASVYRMLDHAKLTDYFTTIVCGNMVTHSKPHPEIFLKASALLGAEPSDCYVIEDSYNGIRAAHAAGMHPIMAPDIVQPDEEIRGLAEAVLPSLFEVKEYFEDVIRKEAVEK